MNTIYVCVGSGCHLKGSYDIIHLLKETLEKEKLKAQIDLKASFCLGSCMAGVTLKVNDTLIHHVTKSNFEALFNEAIAPLLNGES